MKKSFSKKRKNIFTVLTALSLAVQGTLLQGVTVTAEDGTEPSTEAVEENADPIKEVGGDKEESADILSDCFGEVLMYRWERVDQTNYPTDDEWYPSLLFMGADNFFYVSAVSPDSIRLGYNAGTIPGAQRFSEKDNPFYKDSDVDEENSQFLKIKDNAWHYNDSQINLSKNVFYTSNSRDCIYLKYSGRNENNSNNGLDNIYSPRYAMRLSDGNNNMSTGYSYVRGINGDGGSRMLIDQNQTGTWVFQSKNLNNNRGVGFRIFDDIAWHYDPDFEFSYSGYIACQDGSWNWNDCAVWYKGKKLRFSCIKGNTTVKKGQILSISASDYVASDGREESAEGVILQPGEKITVEKGGILSISGTFINNGTIENNGGTILVKEGGSITPFLQGSGAVTKGCGAIKCNGGDIIIQQGGSVYAGLNDDKGVKVPFYLDNSSTLINMGLLVYGSMRLGNAARVELYETAKTYGSYYSYKGEKKSYTVDASTSIADVKKQIASKGGIMIENGLYPQAEDKKTYYYYDASNVEIAEDMYKFNDDAFLKGDTSKVKYLTQQQNDIGMYLADNNKNAPHVLVAKGYESNFNDPCRSASLKMETLKL